MRAYEAAHRDLLHAKFETLWMSHREAYSLKVNCTNQAESFISRLRRMVDGHHH